MKIYSIFDDFDQEAVNIIEHSGIELTVHPMGKTRPDEDQMKSILEEYDGVILGTSQKITEQMFENIDNPRLIASASVGLDHIKIPKDKKNLITIINTPKANARSVAEYTLGVALASCKRVLEGNILYREGKDNKKLFSKPEDLHGKTIGVVGAGTISAEIMQLAACFGMTVIYWTRRPEHHEDLKNKGFRYVSLDELMRTADVISVNLPNNEGTKGIISEQLVSVMKKNAIFVSISRIDTISFNALLEKAIQNRDFYLCLDIDVDKSIYEQIPNQTNIIVTPHIAGGTVETRKRMFNELAKSIVALQKES